tara:strand:+ start:787 stop:6168 length:5382 start_codon:yes stop_codon:yes gene_type:complete
MPRKGLRTIGIKKIIPAQVDFKKPISGSLLLKHITAPSEVPEAHGHIYFKKDGKLYFRSSNYSETDLTEGSSGLVFAFKTSVISIEADATFADPGDGGDWPSNFNNGPSISADASLPGGAAIITNGIDFSHSTLGGDPDNNQYRIDASSITSQTDNGTTLTTTISDHEDDSPTQFTITLKNGNKTVMTMISSLVNSDTVLTVNNLSQYEDAGNSTTFGFVIVNVPFKVNTQGTLRTVTRTFTLQKLRRGVEGTTAKAVNLTTTKQAFVYDENGNNPVGTATINATPINTQGTVIYEFRDSTTNTQLKIGTESFVDFTPPASNNNMPKVIECRIREGDNSQPILARDQITLIGVIPGSDGIAIVLSNESHTLPVQDGTVNHAGSGTKIAVFKGATRLTFVASNPGAGQFSVAASTDDTVTIGSGPTLDTASGAGQNKDAVFGDHSSLGENNAIIAYAVNIEGASGPTVTRLQSLAKSLQGAAGADGSSGSDAKAVSLTVNKQAVLFDQNGQTPDPTSISVSTTTQNTDGTLYYEFQVDDVTKVNSTTSTFTFSKASLAHSDASKGLNGSEPASLLFDHFPIKIEVLVRENGNSNPVVARDQLTIVGLRPGTDGYTVVLENEAHTLPTTGAGVVNYAGSGTNIKVYKGATELAGIISGTPTLGQYKLTNADINVGVGTLNTPGTVSVNTGATPDHLVIANHADMVTDNAVISFTINVENLTSIVKTQSLSKSKDGQDGLTGFGVDLEIDPPVVAYQPHGGSPNVNSILLSATTRGLGTELRSAKFGEQSTAYAWRTTSMSATTVDINTKFLTIQFWIKFKSDEDFNSTQYIIKSDELQLAVINDDLVILTLVGGVERTATYPNYFDSSDPGRWTHVLLTRHSNGIVYFGKNGKYINGVSTGAPNNQFIDHINSNFMIGNQSQVNVNRLHAELSTLVIHDTYLFPGTYAEEFYNSGKVIPNYLDSGVSGYQNVKAYWKLDEDQKTSTQVGTPQTFADSSGRGKDLFVSAGVASVNNSGLFSKNGQSFFTFRVGGVVLGQQDQTFNYVSYTNSTTPGIPTTYDSFSGDPRTVIVELKKDSVDDSVGARDQGSLVALKAGTDGITIILSNPNHTLSADKDNAPTSFTNSSTEIRVAKGATFLTTTTGTPGVGQFKVSSTQTVVPANSFTAGSVSRSTSHYTAANISNWDATKTSAYRQFTVDVEGTSFTVRQNFTTATAGQTGQQGLQGPDGADVGITIRLEKPLAIVRTDSFGNPLSGELANTSTKLYVAKNGADMRISTSININDSATDPAVNQWHPITYDDVSTATGNSTWTRANSPYTRDNDGFPNFATIKAITSLNADAIFRSYRCKVNIDNVLYYPIVTQQIVKVVGEVHNIIPIIEKPTVILERKSWFTNFPEEPVISDYSPSTTSIKVFRQTGDSNTKLTPVANSTSNNAMSNDTYKVILPAANSAFPSINITPGAISTDVANKKVDIGEASAYDNTYYPDPGVADYRVVYKDTVGKIHNFPVRQTMLPTTVYPEIEQVTCQIFINFGSGHERVRTNLGGSSDLKFIPRIADGNISFTRQDTNAFNYQPQVDDRLPLWTAHETYNGTSKGIIFDEGGITAANRTSDYNANLFSYDYFEFSSMLNTFLPVRFTGQCKGAIQNLGDFTMNDGKTRSGCKVGVDLFSFPINQADRTGQYLATVSFDIVDSVLSRADRYADSDVGMFPLRQAAGGATDQALRLFDIPNASGNAIAGDGTTNPQTMTVGLGRHIVPSVFLKRGTHNSNSNVEFPKSGGLYIYFTLNYYVLYPEFL